MVDDPKAASLSALDDVLVPVGGCAQLVSIFYDDEGPFSGRTFLSLEPNEPNSIGAADLLAVTTMDEAYGPRAVRFLLESELRSAVEEHLQAIPVDLDLWDAPDLTAATELWRLLDGLPYVGATKASKLMARKRPRLIPVYDSIVGSTIATADRYWDVFAEFLQVEHNRERIDAMRPSRLAEDELPTLRILDTLIWMRHSRSRNAKRARSNAGL